MYQLHHQDSYEVLYLHNRRQFSYFNGLHCCLISVDDWKVTIWLSRVVEVIHPLQEKNKNSKFIVRALEMVDVS